MPMQTIAVGGLELAMLSGWRLRWWKWIEPFSESMAKYSPLDSLVLLMAE